MLSVLLGSLVLKAEPRSEGASISGGILYPQLYCLVFLKRKAIGYHHYIPRIEQLHCTVRFLLASVGHLYSPADRLV